MRIIPVSDYVVEKLKDIIKIENCASYDNDIRILIFEYKKQEKTKDMI